MSNGRTLLVISVFFFGASLHAAAAAAQNTLSGGSVSAGAGQTALVPATV